MSRASRVIGDTLTWKRTRRTVWVATRAGQFLGMIELTAGGFFANDPFRGTYLGYDSLAEAKLALELNAQVH